jgi:hypothetical protein
LPVDVHGDWPKRRVEVVAVGRQRTSRQASGVRSCFLYQGMFANRLTVA